MCFGKSQNLRYLLDPQMEMNGTRCGESLRVRIGQLMASTQNEVAHTVVIRQLPDNFFNPFNVAIGLRAPNAFLPSPVGLGFLLVIETQR